jgi:hypothetical protein
MEGLLAATVAGVGGGGLGMLLQHHSDGTLCKACPTLDSIPSKSWTAWTDRSRLLVVFLVLIVLVALVAPSILVAR